MSPLRLLLKGGALTFGFYGLCTVAYVLSIVAAASDGGDTGLTSCCRTAKCDCPLTPALGVKMFGLYAGMNLVVAIGCYWLAVYGLELVDASGGSALPLELNPVTGQLEPKQPKPTPSKQQNTGSAGAGDDGAYRDIEPDDSVQPVLVIPQSLRSTVLLSVAAFFAVSYRFGQVTIDRASEITRGPNSDLQLLRLVIWQAVVVGTAVLHLILFGLSWCYNRFAVRRSAPPPARARKPVRAATATAKPSQSEESDAAAAPAPAPAKAKSKGETVPKKRSAAQNKRK